NVVEGFKKLGKPVPEIVAEHLAGGKSFSEKSASTIGDGLHFSLASYKIARPRKVLHTNKGASLIDIGDGALLLEFHSKANSLGADAMEMMQLAMTEVPTAFAGLVIGNEGQHFSAGANLAFILQAGQEKKFLAIEKMISGFQATVVGLRYAPFPVVSAGFGM